ncbi:MAG: hypothetical protein ABF297_04050, partial [Thiogranum sp.]
MPENEFPMATGANHSVLIAGGIGITPILSMLHRLTSEGRSFAMHYSARTHSEFALRDRIAEIAGDSVHFYASRDVCRARWAKNCNSICNVELSECYAVSYA